MTVKDIIILACEFCGEREIVDKLQNSTDLNSRETEKVNHMLSCFNLVNEEIAGEYLPYLVKESVTCDDGKILFSSLSKTVQYIYEIRNAFGFCLPFKNFTNYVEVQGKPKTIVYSFLPDDLALTDEVEFFCGLSARVFAYGVASEFLLMCGVSEDAEIWEERFKESLFVLSRKRKECRLPKRLFR